MGSNHKGFDKRKQPLGQLGASFDYFKLLHSAISLLPIEGPIKHKLLGSVRSRNFAACDKVLEPLITDAQQQCDVDKYHLFATVKALYSKYEGARSPDCEDRALSTWFKAERICGRANRRLRLTQLGVIGRQYIDVLSHAKKIVHSILGVLDWDEISQSCRHGPGVALGLAGVATSGAFKYASSVYTVTPACHQLFRDIVVTDNTWFNLVSKHRTKLDIVDDCEKISFVPKNWKTDRTIGIGPIGNLYVQLGIGEVIVNRLKRVGIDLKDQSNNQLAAYKASVHPELNWGDNYATLDLSMASDTLSRELVKWLVPDSWYRAMNIARTASALLPSGAVVHLCKFSAMGNGFTFPLETLIFYAISQAVCAQTAHSNRIWVYGDDIIVPKGASLLLSEVLRWCGFSVNLEKSYIIGEFYESCGADYLRGVPVRPVFWKSRFEHDRNIYVPVNLLASRISTFPHLSWISDLRSHLIQSCSSPILFGPPIVVGGRVIDEIDDRIVTDDRSLWRLRVKNGIHWCKVYKTAPRFRSVHDDFAFLQARHGLVQGNGLDNNCRVVSIECKTPSSRRGDDGYLRVPIRLTQTGTRRVSVS